MKFFTTEKTRYVIRLADKNLKIETDNSFYQIFTRYIKLECLIKTLHLLLDYFKNLLEHGSNYRIFVAE